VDAALDGTAERALPPLPAPPSTGEADLIVPRLAGTTNQELMVHSQHLLEKQRERLQRTGFLGDDIQYLAEVDAPLLVALTLADPEYGDALLQQYLQVHSRYSYATYRRRSLWTVLGWILRHPNPSWVLGKLASLGRTVLVGGDVEFEEGVGYALMALSVAAAQPGAADRLATRYQPLESERGPHAPVLAGQMAGSDPGTATAVELQQQPRRPRQMGDAWGTHKRRLGALAESLASVLGQTGPASQMVMDALAIPFGFAGYQAPACLSLAESILVARAGNDTDVPQALNAAREAAHNIQDALLCARTTARVNAMGARWWPLPSGALPLAKVARRLRQNPASAEFAAVHVVGEGFPERSGAVKPLPRSLLGATRLSDLAEAYARPLAELLRLNPTLGSDPSQVLPAGTMVNVPDPRMPALLAARFAAQALVDNTLGAPERVALIWSLVPVAVVNATALDAVLARLLLALAPTDPQTLAALEQIAARNVQAADGGVETTMRVVQGRPAVA
jgi:hypothetical protein